MVTLFLLSKIFLVTIFSYFAAIGILTVWENHKNRNCAFVTIKLRKIKDDDEDTLGISVGTKFLKEAKTSPLVIGGTHYFQNKLSDMMKDVNVNDVIDSFNELKRIVEEENGKKN